MLGVPSSVSGLFGMWLLFDMEAIERREADMWPLSHERVNFR